MSSRQISPVARHGNRPVRVFVGTSVEVPARVAAGEPVASAGDVVHGITEALSAHWADLSSDRASGLDEEALEYEAMWEAAASCPGRVLVAAADVRADQLEAVTETEAQKTGPGAMRLRQNIAAKHLVSWHVAMADDDEDDELSWYDATETSLVAEVVSAPGCDPS